MLNIRFTVKGLVAPLFMQQFDDDPSLDPAAVFTTRLKMAEILLERARLVDPTITTTSLDIVTKAALLRSAEIETDDDLGRVMWAALYLEYHQTGQSSIPEWWGPLSEEYGR